MFVVSSFLRFAISVAYFFVIFAHFVNLVLLHIIVTCIKGSKSQNYKNCTAHPEALGREINWPYYFLKNLSVWLIYCPHAKYSLKGLGMYILLAREQYQKIYQKILIWFSTESKLSGLIKLTFTNIWQKPKKLNQEFLKCLLVKL